TGIILNRRSKVLFKLAVSPVSPTSGKCQFGSSSKFHIFEQTLAIPDRFPKKTIIIPAIPPIKPGISCQLFTPHVS
ncbi:unnamed protein product, partial [Rotaria magnacalcarata]